VVAALAAAVTIQLGAGIVLYIFLVSCLVAFYLKQWEELHTGTMKLGYANVTEAQLVTIFTFLLTAYYGGDFWLNECTIFGYVVQYKFLAVALGLGGSAYTALDSLVTVSLFYVNKSSSGSLTWKKAVFDLLPIVTLIVFSALWFHTSPSVLADNPHRFLLILGFLFSNFVGRVVLAKVCSDDFNPIQPLLLPLVLGYINAYFQGVFFREDLFLNFYLVGCIVAYLYFALGVIRDICSYLKIECLSITPHPD